MLKTRVITACILLLVFLLALFFLPKLGWAALVTVMLMQGISEWSCLSKLPGKSAPAYWWLTLVVMLGIVWIDMQQINQAWLLHLCIYAVSAVLWLLLVPVWLSARWKVRQPLLMALTGWAVLIPTAVAMIDLRAQSPWLLLSLMGLVWAADITAYFTGRKFGKHKLAPSISPGKTWEGVIGALLGASVYVLSLVWGNGMAAAYPMLPGLLLASWLVVGLAVFGDLFESVIKRQAGVKDSGALLPGHGGLLDRIDALTSTLPLVAMIMLLSRGLPWAA